MATTHLIPVSEYLSTSYRPDVDYVDGELQERNLGEQDHSDLQYFFAKYINDRRSEWGLKASPELRVQVSESRYRVPDLCVFAAGGPREQIRRTPPLLCIEVLSPEDTLSRVRTRVRDFLDMGVREVWVIDPASRTALIYSGDIMTEKRDGTLTLPGTSFSIPLAESFRVLDED